MRLVVFYLLEQNSYTHTVTILFIIVQSQALPKLKGKPSYIDHTKYMWYVFLSFHLIDTTAASTQDSCRLSDFINFPSQPWVPKVVAVPSACVQYLTKIASVSSILLLHLISIGCHYNITQYNNFFSRAINLNRFGYMERK